MKLLHQQQSSGLLSSSIAPPDHFRIANLVACNSQRTKTHPNKSHPALIAGRAPTPTAKTSIHKRRDSKRQQHQRPHADQHDNVSQTSMHNTSLAPPSQPSPLDAEQHRPTAAPYPWIGHTQPQCHPGIKNRSSSNLPTLPASIPTPCQPIAFIHQHCRR